jgi:hypothetical protein
MQAVTLVPAETSNNPQRKDVAVARCSGGVTPIAEYSQRVKRPVDGDEFGEGRRPEGASGGRSTLPAWTDVCGVGLD